MGNCQAAESATVLIQHPSGRVERLYWSLTASHVMTSNPGHYVAVILTASRPTTTTTSSSASAAPAPPVKYLKLLRPSDTLHLGHVYRLVSFEEVLKEFATKKHVKLSKLLVNNKEKRSPSTRGGEGSVGNPESSSSSTLHAVESQVEAEVVVGEDDQLSSGGRRTSGPVPRPGQWRPALHSIAEIGS